MVPITKGVSGSSSPRGTSHMMRQSSQRKYSKPDENRMSSNGVMEVEKHTGQCVRADTIAKGRSVHVLQPTAAVD